MSFLSVCRSQWPSGLSRVSTADRLLGLRVWVPPGAWMSVVCCQVEISATGWFLVQRSFTDRGVSLCVIYKPQEWGGHGPRWAVEPEKEFSPSVRCNSPTWALATSFLRFLDHIQWPTTVGRTALNKGSALAETWTWQHTTLTRQTFMSPAGFEPPISASIRLQSLALDPLPPGMAHVFYET